MHMDTHTHVSQWQGGILGRDGCVYCIPASGRSVLRIATTTNFDGNEEDRVQLIGENIVPNHKDKWQGGYQGLDGSLYFIPENGYRIMKVTPPVAFSLLDGKLRHDDCKVEML